MPPPSGSQGGTDATNVAKGSLVVQAGRRGRQAVQLVLGLRERIRKERISGQQSKIMWCVVYLSPKGWAATGQCTPPTIRLAQLVEQSP